jgi:hypothetical protein
MALEGLHSSEIFNVTIGRAVCEACSTTQHLLWDQGNNSLQLPQEDAKNLGLHPDRRLTWHKHIFAKLYTFFTQFAECTSTDYK